jgi:hypothetical protein
MVIFFLTNVFFNSSGNDDGDHKTRGFLPDIAQVFSDVFSLIKSAEIPIAANKDSVCPWRDCIAIQTQIEKLNIRVIDE